MLQSWGTDFTYEQPVQPIKVDRQRFALPPDFVQGLDFLRPFTGWVQLIDGKLYAASNSLIVEYEIGACEFGNVSFSEKICRILASFATAPEGAVIRGTKNPVHLDGRSGALCRYLEPVLDPYHLGN